MKCPEGLSWNPDREFCSRCQPGYIWNAEWSECTPMDRSVINPGTHHSATAALFGLAEISDLSVGSKLPLMQAVAILIWLLLKK